MDQILFTIAIPTYNRLNFLKQALSDAKNQVEVNLEIIIFDNCSTDGTFEYIQEQAAQDKRIKVVRNSENIGAIRNYEQILNYVNGKYLLLLSDDDAIESNFCQQAIQDLQNNPTAKVWFSGFDYFFDPVPYNGQNVQSVASRLVGLQSGDHFIKQALLTRAQFIWSGTVYDIATLRQVGGFTCGSNSSDWAATLSVAGQGDVYFNPAILSHYRMAQHNESYGLFQDEPVKELIRGLKFYQQLQDNCGPKYKNYFFYYCSYFVVGRISKFKTLGALPSLVKTWKANNFSYGYCFLFAVYTLFYATFRKVVNPKARASFKRCLNFLARKNFFV